jgi:hypothetical protein
MPLKLWPFALFMIRWLSEPTRAPGAGVGGGRGRPERALAGGADVRSWGGADVWSWRGARTSVTGCGKTRVSQENPGAKILPGTLGKRSDHVPQGPETFEGASRNRKPQRGSTLQTEKDGLRGSVPRLTVWLYNSRQNDRKFRLQNDIQYDYDLPSLNPGRFS